MTDQVPLQLPIEKTLTFDNYQVGENLDVVDFLRSATDDPQLIKSQLPWYFLAVPDKSGLTHLLQALVHRASGMNIGAAYLDLLAANDLGDLTQMLGDAEQKDVVIVDNVQLLEGREEYQQALFGFLVAAQAKPRQRVIVGSHKALTEMDIELNDLKSRLQLCTTFKIERYSDKLISAILKSCAEGRGFELSDEAISFMLLRCERSLPSLIHNLETIDTVALTEKRRVTIPLIKQALHL